MYAARLLLNIITSIIMVESCEDNFKHRFDDADHVSLDDEDSHGPDGPYHNLHGLVLGLQMTMIVPRIKLVKIFSGIVASACVRWWPNSFQRTKG